MKYIFDYYIIWLLSYWNYLNFFALQTLLINIVLQYNLNIFWCTYFLFSDFCEQYFSHLMRPTWVSCRWNFELSKMISWDLRTTSVLWSWLWQLYSICIGNWGRGGGEQLLTPPSLVQIRFWYNSEDTHNHQH